MRILLAEDEKQTAKALKFMLEKNKFSVDMVHSGTDAWKYISQLSYDVIALDIMMPGMSGMQVLQSMRNHGINTPTLFITAKDQVEDRVAGLESGADDYLCKPFSMAEFVARVRALSRRSTSYRTESLQNGNTVLDVNRYLVSVGSEKILLNNKEFQLFELFMKHPGFIFSTQHLMDQIWGMDSESNIDVVWTHIGFLRKKLKKLHSDLEIRTVRGAGYVLDQTEESRLS